jgi:hypothetical protein
MSSNFSDVIATNFKEIMWMSYIHWNILHTQQKFMYYNDNTIYT